MSSPLVATRLRRTSRRLYAEQGGLGGQFVRIYSEEGVGASLWKDGAPVHPQVTFVTGGVYRSHCGATPGGPTPAPGAVTVRWHFACRGFMERRLWGDGRGAGQRKGRGHRGVGPDAVCVALRSGRPLGGALGGRRRPGPETAVLTRWEGSCSRAASPKGG